MAEAATLVARYSWREGDRAATDRYMSEGLDAVADRPGSRARADALRAQTGFLMLAGRFEEAIRLGAEALPLIEALGMEEARARLHVVLGCARCCLGDTRGLDEIETGIRLAEQIGSVQSVSVGYGNLSNELFFFARLDEARRAWRQNVEVTERYGLGGHLRSVRHESACWAYADGDWEEALTVANDAIAKAESGERGYSDAPLLALRAAIRLAHGDTAGADADSARAAELGRRSDAQAQSHTFCARAAVALAVGKRDEAGDVASELLDIGTVMVPAFCSPFPTLVDVAWVFRDLGRSASSSRRCSILIRSRARGTTQRARSAKGISCEARTSSNASAMRRRPPTPACEWPRRSRPPVKRLRPARTTPGPRPSTERQAPNRSCNRERERRGETPSFFPPEASPTAGLPPHGGWRDRFPLRATVRLCNMHVA